MVIRVDGDILDELARVFLKGRNIPGGDAGRFCHVSCTLRNIGCEIGNHGRGLLTYANNVGGKRSFGDQGKRRHVIGSRSTDPDTNQ